MAFFSWWYGNGWQQLLKNFRSRVLSVVDSFSVRQLLKTLFAPWKRIISQPGRSVEERFRAAIDNAFSRVVGFFVRLAVLLAAMFSLLIVIILGIAEIIVWPLLPIAIPGLIIAGLFL
jgi:hypothetical protein